MPSPSHHRPLILALICAFSFGTMVAESSPQKPTFPEAKPALEETAVRDSAPTAEQRSTHEPISTAEQGDPSNLDKSMDLYRRSEHFFLDGKNEIRHGEYFESQNERLIVKGTYHRGQKNGLWQEWHPSGTIASEVHFDLGVKVNTEKRWSTANNLIYRVSYLDGQKEGPEEAWHNDGLIRKFTGHWKGGQREGPYQEWHDNGQEKLRCTYKFGQRHGQLKAWNPKGEVIREELYQHGALLKLHIESEKYNNGNMKLAYSYYLDPQGQEVRHGRFNKWFPNGESWIQCTYTHGQIDGLWQYGKIDGLHCRQEFYANGIKHGTFKWYHQGQLIREQVWRDGEMISERQL